jgi:hypothetical protein
VITGVAPFDMWRIQPLGMVEPLPGGKHLYFLRVNPYPPRSEPGVSLLTLGYLDGPLSGRILGGPRLEVNEPGFGRVMEADAQQAWAGDSWEVSMKVWSLRPFEVAVPDIEAVAIEAKSMTYPNHASFDPGEYEFTIRPTSPTEGEGGRPEEEPVQ